MHTEIKLFCLEQKWREALKFTSQIPPGPNSSKTDNLLAIGRAVTESLPIGEKRDRLLVPVIEGLLQLGDIENPGSFLLVLRSDALREKFAVTLKETLLIRQWDFVYSG